MITAAGVGSGIDIESILSQLNQLERQPINALNSQREALNVELSAYGTVKSALSGLEDSLSVLGKSQQLGGFVASSSDEEVFTATANGGETAENHEIEVVSLATTHRMASSAYASSDAAVETGTLTISAGGTDIDIVIDSSNNTLEGLRDAINDSLENTAVSASIISVDGGSRLVLTAKESGTDGEFTLSRTGPGKKPRSTGFTEISAPVDASLIVHGFTVTRSSNTISDVIEGVTLNLTGVGKATIDTQRDTSSLKDSVNEFISKYNAMADTLTNLGERELQGDQLPRGIDSRMRAAFLAEVDFGNGDTTTPFELGFTFDRYGRLSLDSAAFEDALDKGVNRYVEAFAQADTGLAARFTDLIDEYTGAGGIIDTREDGVDSRRNSLDDQIDRLEYRAEIVADRLRQQYTAMDQVVQNLQSTSSFLISRLDSLNLYR